MPFENIFYAFKKVSKLSGTIITVGLSIEFKGSLIHGLQSHALVGGAYLAADKFGNYAYVFTGTAYMRILGLVKSNCTENTDNSLKSFYIGGNIGISIDLAVRWGKYYEHIEQLQGEEIMVDADIPLPTIPIDVSFIGDRKKSFNGLELSCGPGIGGGIGVSKGNSWVLGFSDLDIKNYNIQYNKLEKYVESKNTQLQIQINLNPFNKEKLLEQELSIKTGFRGNTTDNSIELVAYAIDKKLNVSLKTILIKFKYVTDYYYKSKNVVPPEEE